MTDLNEKSPDLPKGWMWTEVGEISKLIRGVTYKRDQASDSFGPRLLPILRAGNIQERLILDKDLVFVDTQLVSTEQLVRAGDVILAMSSGSVNKVGKTAQAHFNWNGSFGAFCGLLRPKEEIDPRYFGAFFETRNYREKISNLAAGVNINNLRRQHLESLPIPLAPLIEQHRIVARIDELFSRLDAGVEALQKAKAQLRRYRLAVLKAAVEGRLTEEWRKAHPEVEPAGKIVERLIEERKSNRESLSSNGKRSKKIRITEHPFEASMTLSDLPDTWTWANIAQIGLSNEQAVLTGPFGTCLGREDFIDRGVPVLTIGCLTEKGIQLDNAVFVSEKKADELHRYRLQTGDLLFSRMASVGRAGYVDEGLEGALFNYHIMRLRLDSNVLHPKYYFCYVQVSREVQAYLKEINHGATRDGINTQQLRSMPVALPPTEEQREIVFQIDHSLSVSDELINEINRDLVLATRLRQSILKRAFEGRLVPHDPNDEPASMLLERIKAERSSQISIESRRSRVNNAHQTRLIQ